MKPEALSVPKHRSEAPKHWMFFVRRDKFLYLFLFPGLVYFMLFQYLPMLGLVISFQDYSLFRGISGSEWVGLKHYKTLLQYPEFWQILRNTLIISLYRIVFFFPVPIILSIMLNEIRLQLFKRSVQTIVYLPHFLSWVVVAGISYAFLSTQGGVINSMLQWFGFEPVPFLMSTELFRGLLVAQGIWKESGWGTVIFLAALSGVNPELYEAARMDGAGRFKQILHVSLPGLASTIIVLLIIRIGHIMDAGFEQVFIMYNSMVYDVADIIDTFVYRRGIVEGDFSFVTAMGLFKSVIGVALVVMANHLAKRFGEESIY
jgi:putative aldouronate transport system permease protein